MISISNLANLYCQITPWQTATEQAIVMDKWLQSVITREIRCCNLFLASHPANGDTAILGLTRASSWTPIFIQAKHVPTSANQALWNNFRHEGSLEKHFLSVYRFHVTQSTLTCLEIGILSIRIQSETSIVILLPAVHKCHKNLQMVLRKIASCFWLSMRWVMDCFT